MVYTVLSLRRSDNSHSLDLFDTPEKAMSKVVSVAQTNSPSPINAGFLADWRASIVEDLKRGGITVIWESMDEDMTVFAKSMQVR